jgi:hypothetical protein
MTKSEKSGLLAGFLVIRGEFNKIALLNLKDSGGKGVTKELSGRVHS